MQKVRTVARNSGLTQQVIGERMGYPPESARQSVSLFFKSKDPSLRMVMRFAKAMDVKVEELLR